MCDFYYNDKSYIFNSAVLREYDIRGIAGKELSNKGAFFIGKSFASYISKNSDKKDKVVCVSFDARLTSPDFKKYVTEGLFSSGIKVIDLGMGTTPMLYFASLYLKADGAIMVTGSHNHKSYNGFKILKDSFPLTGEEIKFLGSISEHGDFINKKGSVKSKRINKHYSEKLKKVFSKKMDIKIVWDAANSPVADILKDLCPSVPGEHILINEEIDGNFPSHHPNPSQKENMEDLVKKVKLEKADAGFSFDGDADRLGVVDNKGRIVDIDKLLILLARSVLKKFPKSNFIADVKTSQIFFDDIKNSGGNSVMWKTGHSLIKLYMLKIDAVFAGESSGHIFYKENNCFDDALYAALKLLNILAEEKTSLSKLLEELPDIINTGEIYIDVDESKKFSIVEKIKEYVKAKNNYSELIDIDGVRVSYGDSWWLLRASNTQPSLVVRCEAKSQENFEKMKKEVLDYLLLFGIRNITI